MTKLLKDRGFWGIIVLVLLGTLTSVLLEGQVFEVHSPLGHLLFSAVFSLVPGLLWLYFFYLQDKHEREPHHYLVGVFIAGAALAYGVSVQVSRAFDAAHATSLYSPLAQLLTAILVYGVLQELVKFLVVRYTVYNSNEFNEPVDGVVYSIAASLGAASAYNMVYLNGLDAFNLGVVPIRIIEYYLVSAVIGGLLGYFLGRAKFEPTSANRHQLTGFGIAIVLNGLYNFFADRLHGLSHNLWNELIFTVAFVVVLFAVMFFLLQKSLAKSPFQQQTA